MGTTLENGTYLPDEGERNCYEGLAGNWVALDNHLGSTNIHVTINDKQAWNGHVADTTIHVTSADKQAWNGHVADSVKHVTAEDKNKWDAVTSKAEDSDVVHTSGNETVGGVKTFSGIPIFATFDGIRFRCAHNPSAYVTFRNANQGNPGSIIFSSNDGNVSTSFHLVDKTLIPYTNGDIDLGTSLRKWKSLNGINPGALSLPNLSNGIDISSYITLNSDSSYTPLSDGYIYICCYSSSACGLWVRDSNNNGVSTRSIGSVPTYNNLVSICIPVVKNVSISIFSPGCANILTAKFYPCQGNV